MRLLQESGLSFLIGGMFAVITYTGLRRPVKDLDVFCKAGDYPRILAYFRALGYETEVEDERWIAKIRKGEFFIDILFNTAVAVTPVADDWFAGAHTANLYGRDVPLISPTELIWSKALVQDRHRYDGSDIAHVILKQCENVDWRRLLSRMEQYREVLLIHVLNFGFIYPTERRRIPGWLLGELIARVRDQADLPIPQTKICRGRLFSRGDYQIDIMEWGFADAIGDGAKTHGR